MTTKKTIFTHVVCFNNEKTILSCVKSLLAQVEVEQRIIISDNCSTDNTLQILSENFPNLVEIRRNDSNLGFSKAHNIIANYALKENADFLFIVNPDLRLEKNCLSILVDVLIRDSIAGVACPKLYRADENLNPISPLTFDSTGMYITPEIRHFDRGSNEIDTGQYNQAQYVFGASGACMLARREFINDVSLKKSFQSMSVSEERLYFFDPNFFAYREDADLAWRMQWLGWKCRYQPKAVAYHQRQVLPTNRAKLNPEINAYGVKNRFLLQFNNFSWKVNLTHLPFLLWRNLLVIFAVLIQEKTSFAGLRSAFQLYNCCRRNFYSVSTKRRVPFWEIKKWFSFAPFAEPALEFSESQSSIKNILLLVVNYNSGKRLSPCISALIQAVENLSNKYNLQIVVSDNASDDSSFKDLEKIIVQSAQLALISNKENIGFAEAINKAQKQFSSDATLILNPDIKINSNALNQLIETLNNNSDLAAVAPVLKSDNGKIQYHYLLKNFPCFYSILAEQTFLHKMFPKNTWTTEYTWTSNKLFLRYLKNKISRSIPTYSPKLPLLIPQPAAACLLIRSTDFERIQGFDSNFKPAWFEDVDFAKRLYNKKRYFAVISSAEVIHEGGYSAENKEEFYKIWQNNLLYYIKKHLSYLEYIILKPLILISTQIKLLAVKLKN